MGVLFERLIFGVLKISVPKLYLQGGARGMAGSHFGAFLEHFFKQFLFYLVAECASGAAPISATYIGTLLSWPLPDFSRRS